MSITKQHTHRRPRSQVLGCHQNAAIQRRVTRAIAGRRGCLGHTPCSAPQRYRVTERDGPARPCIGRVHVYRRCPKAVEWSAHPAPLARRAPLLHDLHVPSFVPAVFVSTYISTQFTCTHAHMQSASTPQHAHLTTGTPLLIDPELPVGWERVMSSDGRPVFVDHVHGTHTVALPPGEHVSLPLGGRWEQRIGAGHRLFFVDHELKVTQWGVPEEYVVPIACSAEQLVRSKSRCGSCRQRFPHFSCTRLTSCDVAARGGCEQGQT